MKVRNKKLLLYRVIIFTVCILALFIMDFFKIGEKGFKIYSGGAGIPDMQFGYKPETLYDTIRRLGVDGRLFYLRFLLFDFIFIISFAMAQAEIMKILIGKAFSNSKWRYAIVLSYLRGIFDMAENILIIILLTCYPKQLIGIAGLANISTSMKFISLALWVVAGLSVFTVNKLSKDEKTIF